MENLAVALANMSAQVLEQAPCTPEIIEELQAAASLKGGARKRQLKFVTKLLRQHPHEALYDFVTRFKGEKLKTTRAFHELEYLRNALIEEALEHYRISRDQQLDWEEDWPSEVVPDICRQLPEVDGMNLKRLAHLFARTRNPRHSREIFRLLKSAQELS